MRRIIIALATGAVMALAFLLAPSEENAAKTTSRHWVKIVFGADGKDASWDGKVTIRNGRITDVAPWAFEQRDQLKVAERAWKITTGIPKQRRVTYSEPQRGVLVEIESGDDTTLHVETKQGNFLIQTSKLTAGRPVGVLDGKARVELMGGGSRVADTETDDDFAAIAVDKDGKRHVAWIAFDVKQRQNHLLIRNVDDPNSKPQQIAQGKEFASLFLFAMPTGELRAVWCAPDKDGNWDVYSATSRGKGWTSERVTTTKGTDFHLAAALSKGGELWLAWQSFRNGNGDVYAQRWSKGKWLPSDVAVTTAKSNEWQPAVTVDSQGRAWIGYDSYANGNYDVFLRSVTIANNKPAVGQRIVIAQSKDFEAHASVCVDVKDRIWVAYDAAGPRWGKDFRNVPTQEGGKYAEPLHASRRLELRCVINGKVHEPRDPLPQILPPRPIRGIVRKPSTKPARFYEYPQLTLDGDGRLWLFFRMNRQGYCPHPPMGIDWKIYATTFTDKGWLTPIEMPRSQGRQNQRVAYCVGPDKRLCCAWADGNRFASVNRKYTVFHGRLPAIHESAADIPLKATVAQRPGRPDPAPKPPWTLKRNGQEYHLIYGDMHRHTNISRCSPTIDGCLTDAYRYALDAAELDFLAVTDHTRDVDPFSWWRTQQAGDLFHVPGRHVPIYAYERSNTTATGGHRNVFFMERGWEVNPSDHWYVGRGLKAKETRPDKTLYPWMKKHGNALTAAHTPAYAAKQMSGTWTFHDPQLEPVAEIYQGFRRSYERPDKGVRAEASLWYALANGHKLGFIGSSDHISTHVSYACLWVKEKTRAGIFEALTARRTFAATDRIALDVRIDNAIMGETIKHTGKAVKLRIRAHGTAPICELQIVRSGKVLATLSPMKQDLDLSHVDKTPLAGKSYYYVRLVQRDGARAWGSPIWIER